MNDHFSDQVFSWVMHRTLGIAGWMGVATTAFALTQSPWIENAGPFDILLAMAILAACASLGRMLTESPSLPLTVRRVVGGLLISSLSAAMIGFLGFRWWQEQPLPMMGVGIAIGFVGREETIRLAIGFLGRHRTIRLVRAFLADILRPNSRE